MQTWRVLGQTIWCLCPYNSFSSFNVRFLKTKTISRIYRGPPHFCVRSIRFFRPSDWPIAFYWQTIPSDRLAANAYSRNTHFWQQGALAGAPRLPSRIPRIEHDRYRCVVKLRRAAQGRNIFHRIIFPIHVNFISEKNKLWIF